MNRLLHIISAAILCLAGISCVKEKREATYISQESKIDQYITSNMVVNSEEGTDTLRVVYSGGANRLVRQEGLGEELKANGTVSFYFAGYSFTSGKSTNNLFATNHEETANSARWDLTDADYNLMTIDMADTELVKGLRDGLLGVKSGEHCEILFTGKYGYGKKPFGTVPANSALLFEIWVEAVSNN
jgi:FKBP-type peptidyl-prolyl cis-trans isomerase